MQLNHVLQSFFFILTIEVNIKKVKKVTTDLYLCHSRNFLEQKKVSPSNGRR
jgi:hypothetical protein